MGADPERLRYTRVLSTSLQSKLVHKAERDVKIALQARHTRVTAIVAWSLIAVLQKSGMRERTSGGMRLIGAKPFFRDLIRRRTSKASCSRVRT